MVEALRNYIAGFKRKQPIIEAFITSSGRYKKIGEPSINAGYIVQLKKRNEGRCIASGRFN